MRVATNPTAKRFGFRSSLLHDRQLPRLGVVAMLWGIACCCYAEHGEQTYTVRVAEGIGVTSPPRPDVTLLLTPETDVFPDQIWRVQSNSTVGIVVEFATNQAFTHETLANTKVDARMDLAIPSVSGSAQWIVTKATDSSAYALGDEVAVVQLVSDGVGTAQVSLKMTVLHSSLELIPIGDYHATVFCTISLP